MFKQEPYCHSAEIEINRGQYRSANAPDDNRYSKFYFGDPINGYAVMDYIDEKNNKDDVGFFAVNNLLVMLG